jgi:stress response protein YsnF
MKTLVALYDELEEARDAIEDLVDAGFDRDDISLVAYDPEGKYADFLEAEEGDETDMEDSVGFGAVVGTLGGLVVSIATLGIPGIGPVLTAGTLGATLLSAGVGAAAGGLIGALVEAGIPDEEAEMYAEGVRRGGTLVVLDAADERAGEAADILEEHDPVDMEKRAEAWREEGWEGFEKEEEPYTEEEVFAERERYEETIPVVEEEVRVGKREVEGVGGVRVRSYVREEPVEEEVTLREERVTVERHEVDRPVDEAGVDVDELEEEVIEMTETREEVVVGKEARVVEEVVVSKEVDERTETVSETERHTEVEVEELEEVETEEVESDLFEREEADFAAYEPAFRRHYESTYAPRDYSFKQCRPAYRYGYDLATVPQYRDREWEDVEPEARRRWEERNQGTWRMYRDAVQYGWAEARGA